MLVHKTYFSLEFVKFVWRWTNVGAVFNIWCQQLANCPTIFQSYFNVGPTLSCYLGYFVVKAGVSLNVFISRVTDPAADELLTVYYALITVKWYGQNHIFGQKKYSGHDKYI